MRVIHKLPALAHHDLLRNASSMLGTTVITSGLGFVYWWLAARLFPPQAVGFASAAIAAMTLLATLGVLGLGTLLIGELPQRAPEQQRTLLTTALLVAAAAALVLGTAFALLAPLVTPELRALGSNVLQVALFAAGVVLTTVTLVLDQALIGLLRGQLQLWRNAIFAVTKLGLLFAAGIWLTNHSGLSIYTTWGISNVVSLAYLVGWAGLRGVRLRAERPQWAVLQGLPRAALGHHGLNLAIQLTNLAVPVVVAGLLTAAQNASFYMAWLLVNFIFAVPYTLTTVLYAASSAERTAFTQKTRLTLSLALGAGLFCNLGLWLTADLLMGIFGRSYAEQAAGALRILGLGVFPLIVKDHFVVIRRVSGKLGGTALLVLLGGLLELGAVVVGAQIGGLHGLSVGWVLALVVQAVAMLPAVYEAAVLPVIVPLSKGWNKFELIGALLGNEPPVVSIIINNYNYGHFLREAIDSALRQSYAAVEVIVVDDGSTDDSRDTIRSYGDRISAMFKANGGQASALNDGFAQSRGDVIIFLDADDLLLPDTAKRVATAFLTNPALGRVHYRMQVVDGQGQPTGVIKPAPHVPMASGDLRRHVLTFPDDMNWLPTSGNAFAARVLRQIFPIPEQSFRILADLYLSHVTPLFGPVVALDGIGACYRVHGANNYEVSTITLAQIRCTIQHWRLAHSSIQQFAAALGLRDKEDALSDLPSVTYFANRMISRKLAPSLHPIPGDRPVALCLQGITAASHRFDTLWPMRVLFMAWFVAMLLAPTTMAWWLAKKWLFPAERRRFNRVLGRLHYVPR